MPGPRHGSTPNDHREARQNDAEEMVMQLQNCAYLARGIGGSLDDDGNPPALGELWGQVGQELENIVKRVQKLAR